MGGRAVRAAGSNWQEHPVKHGVCRVECSSWSGFNDFVLNRLTEYEGYIFRGQATTRWRLQPTLDRRLGNLSADKYRTIRKDHLDRFKVAARGMRGPNPGPMNSETEWWALGQHHGLATPLLDWTESPFVAAFFAFTEKLSDEETGDAVVYGLAKSATSEIVNGKIKKGEDFGRSVPKINLGIMDDFLVEVVKDDRDDNRRLISQRGLFTIAPDNVCILRWVNAFFADEYEKPILFKITVPRSQREPALRTLNLMNVNYVSLYGDIEGASNHCNFYIDVEGY